MEWKKIREAGYLYEINEKGQVRSLKRATPKLIAKKKDSRVWLIDALRATSGR